MATRKSAAGAPAYEPETHYGVKFTRIVSVYGVQLLPFDEHEMDGKTLNTIIATEGADCVDRAEPR